MLADIWEELLGFQGIGVNDNFFELNPTFSRNGGPPKKFRGESSEIVIKETIEVRDELKEFTGIYTTDGVWNRSQNLFTELGPEKTLWRQNNEFRCEGLMMKFMTTFLPFMFTRESKNQMKSFKAFAEGLG